VQPRNNIVTVRFSLTAEFRNAQQICFGCSDWSECDQ